MRAHLLFLVALVGCRRQPPLPTPPVTTTAVSVDAAADADADAPDAFDAAIAAVPTADPLTALPAATLVGAEAWALAAPALDKLPVLNP